MDCGIASLTSLHCRCPLAASINRSVQRMREQLATNQAEDRIVDHRWGEKKKKLRSKGDNYIVKLRLINTWSDTNLHPLVSPLVGRL